MNLKFDIEYLVGTLLEEKLRALGFTESECLRIFEAMSSVCHSCWNAEPGCQCWNDE